MQKVVTINLNGNAYQIDEDGFGALVAYLDGAAQQLKDNPDRPEILADLEQAIAEKCQRVLGPHKTVVNAADVDQIIKAMGPVHAAGDTDQHGAAGARTNAGASSGAGFTSQTHAGAPRRLYLLRDGSMLAGVCNGFAAYFHVDVTIIRIIMIVLTLATKGGFALIYIVLAFVIPPADTPEDQAAAHGQPFNAQELIDRAKDKYASFKSDRDKRRYWKWEHKEWKRQWRRQWRRYDGWSGQAAPPIGYGSQILAGILVPVFSIVSALLFWLWIYCVASLVMTREVFGRAVPDDVPLWVAVLVLLFAYQSISWPLHAARRGSYYTLAGRHYGMFVALDGMMGLGISALIVWLGYQYVPEVHELLRTLPDVIRSFAGR
jgi:phage shock protein PspC (stress-responsive transcriptional regulator)